MATKDKALTTLSDNLLLKRLEQGDEASFEALFHRHYDRVYGLLFRLLGNRDEAEELLQEVFLKLYRHAFGKRPFGSTQPPNLSGWLYRVATNEGYNAIRGRQRQWQRNLLLVPDPAGAPGAEVAVERKERETAVRAALSTLPPHQAQLLLLRQMDVSYAELAEACDIAPGSVGTLLRRAAAAFREAYQREIGN
ncbi:MAG: RNA polymerase sigma factor [Ardenticatenaceae bacterium]|nr:RNA polymerase sigma factor [Ardenticatenaceae bacterium]